MSTAIPIPYPAKSWSHPDWCSQHQFLWHGCVSYDAQKIMSYGVDPMAGRVNTDFGRGFYTTTLERQARHWAWERYYATPAGSGPFFPVVIRFRVERTSLAALQHLAFVSGDYHHDEDYWSLVQWCRQSTPVIVNNHKCTKLSAPISANWFDVVYGPVAAGWRQRTTLNDFDQVSFHTRTAVDVLNALIDRWRFSGRTSDDVRLFPLE